MNLIGIPDIPAQIPLSRLDDGTFPDVPCPIEPFGGMVVIQVRSPKTRSAKGILYAAETQDVQKWNTQEGIVRALGPMAYRFKGEHSGGALFQGGAWCQEGDYVRFRRATFDRMEVHVPGTDNDHALFVMVHDTDLLGKVPDPAVIRNYV